MPASADDEVWFQITLTAVNDPEEYAVPGGVIRGQLLEGNAEGWPLQVAVCHPSLPISSPTGSPKDCDEVSLPETHSSWGDVWDIVDTNHDNVPDPGDETVYARGVWDPNAQILAASYIQIAAPSGPGRMLAVTDSYTGILDNIGMGAVTFDGHLESAAPQGRWAWVAGGNVTASKRMVYYHVGGDYAEGPWKWRAETPGFTLPTAGTYLSTMEFSSQDRYRETGVLVPSRIAYGRVPWDWLWHGTCEEDPEIWCLPVDHPRLAVHTWIEEDGGGCTCQMACPDITGEADQVKYDFEVILDFIETAHDGEAVPVAVGSPSSLHDVHLTQRVALRIMPVAPLGDGTGVSAPKWMSDGCDAERAEEYWDNGDTDTTDPDTDDVEVDWLDPSHVDYTSQIELLVQALTGQAGDVVETYTGRPANVNLAEDGRVFSLDVGSVGTDGEWTVTGYVDVSLDDRPNSDFLTCATIQPSPPPPSTYDVLTDQWWNVTLDAWTSGFPEPTVPGDTPAPLVVGKVQYSLNAVEPYATEKAVCYTVDEYGAGRRGSDLLVNKAVGDYDEPAHGVRYDSWGVEEMQGQWWSPVNGGGFRTNSSDFIYAKESAAWWRGSFQAEIWNTIDDMASLNRDMRGAGVDEEAYGYWDLDEAIRFSIAEHFSLFNFKSGIIPFVTSWGMVDPKRQQETAQHFCDCSPTPAGACVPLALERLLVSTGFRIRPVSRTQLVDTLEGDDVTTELWLINTGNTPPYTPYQLEFAVVPRDRFDPFGTEGVDWRKVETFPRTSRAPYGEPLDDVIGDAELNGDLHTASTFDLRTLLVLHERNPSVQAKYDGTTSGSTSTCLDDSEDDALSFNSAQDPDPGDRTACTYATSAPVGGLCAIYPCAPPPTWSARVTTTFPAPDEDGEYVVIFRFQDKTTDEEHAVPLDMPINLVLGDDSSPRWWFYGYLTVVAS
ncbi:MAG TPA: hypothetical protein PKB00_11020 [Microthrixaceae bacterium]|nr:hypothetical protein [Microthrixaceae bacterium]